MASPLKGFRRDALFQVLGSIFASGSMLAMNLLAVRILGKEGFGAFGAFQAGAIWCSTVFLFGGTNSIMYQAGLARRSGDRPKAIIGSLFVYMSAVAIGTFLLAVSHPNNVGIQSSWSDIASLVLYSTYLSFVSLWIALLIGLDLYRTVNIFSACQSSLLAFGIILGALTSKHPETAIWGGISGGWLILLISIVVSIRSWGLALPSPRDFWKYASSIGMRSYVVMVTETLAETWGILYLSSRHQLAGVAALVACERISSALAKPASMLQSVIMGKMAGQTGGDTESRLVLKLARSILLVMLFPGLVVIAFSQNFTRLLLGESFASASEIMSLYLLAAVARAYAITVVGLLVGQGCPRAYVLLKFLLLAVTVGGVAYSVPRLGTVGVAWTHLTVSVLAASLSGLIVSRQAGGLRYIFRG